MPAQMAGQTPSFFGPAQGIDSASAVTVNASGIYVAGSGLGKYDLAGNELWTLGGNGGIGVAADTTGVYTIGGATLRKYSGGGSEMWTIILQQEFTTAAVAVDSSGVYAAVRDGFRHFLAKYSSDGSQLWTSQWDAPSQGVSLAVITDTTGVYVLSFGTVGSGAGLLARKYDPRGNALWQREYATAYPIAFSAAQPSGFFVAGGIGFGFVNTSLHRYDADGNELWSLPLATPTLTGVAADTTGVYIIGSTSSAGPALPGQCRSGSGGDSFVRKYDLNGAELWTREFGVSGATLASAVAADSSGGVYVVGREGSGLGSVVDDFPSDGGAFLAKLGTTPAVTGAGPHILPDCIVNAASYIGGGVAPGEIVTLFGSGLGPPDLVPLSLTDGQTLATTLAGTRIWFNNAPAPLMYVSDQQSSAIVP